MYLSTSTTPSNAPLPRNQRFTPSHSATYTRIGLGYSAVAIAGYIFYLDYVLKQEFADTKTLTLYAVVAYFVLNSALTLWIWFGERGIVFAGSRAESKKTTLNLKICSNLPHRKYSPVYRLAVSWRGAGPSEAKELEAPFTMFFTSDGYFAPAEFEAWLRQEIPLIGSKGSGKGAIEDGSGHATGPSDRLSAAGEDGDTITLGARTNEAAPATPSKKRGRPRKDASADP